jgi:hypothetical protein
VDTHGDQGGHVLAAPDAAEVPFGFEHSGGNPSFLHRSVFQLFTLPMVVRATEIIDSMQLVLVKVVASRPFTPRRRAVNISSSPSNRLAAASG